MPSRGAILALAEREQDGRGCRQTGSRYGAHLEKEAKGVGIG
jgi:hypothetical protein